MADLISLLCPSCGGKLQVSPKASTMTCQHCGNEHLVRHEAGAITLEAYARCPQCGRNDKSEKVTAVIASQSQEISGMEHKNEVVIDGQGRQQVIASSVPFTRKQVSILGQQLAPPEQPIINPNLQSQGVPSTSPGYLHMGNTGHPRGSSPVDCYFGYRIDDAGRHPLLVQFCGGSYPGYSGLWPAWAGRWWYFVSGRDCFDRPGYLPGETVS